MVLTPANLKDRDAPVSPNREQLVVSAVTRKLSSMTSRPGKASIASLAVEKMILQIQLWVNWRVENA